MCFCSITRWIFTIGHWNFWQCVSIHLCDISILVTFLTFWVKWPTFIDMRVEGWFSLTSVHIFLKKKLSYFGSPNPKLKMVLFKKSPSKISFLLSIWVLIGVKMKILLEKFTQVILHFGIDHGLSMSKIYLVIFKKPAF